VTTRPVIGAATGHAGTEHERAAARRRRKEGRERRTRQRLGDGGVEERAQERARIIAR
jgi:hypothetical protein